jgi:hypothetical protein
MLRPPGRQAEGSGRRPRRRWRRRPARTTTPSPCTDAPQRVAGREASAPGLRWRTSAPASSVRMGGLTSQRGRSWAFSRTLAAEADLVPPAPATAQRRRVKAREARPVRVRSESMAGWWKRGVADGASGRRVPCRDADWRTSWRAESLNLRKRPISRALREKARPGFEPGGARFCSPIVPPHRDGEPPTRAKSGSFAGLSLSRGDWIRTSDRPAPSRVRYQTAPLPVADIQSLPAGGLKAGDGN